MDDYLATSVPRLFWGFLPDEIQFNAHLPDSETRHGTTFGELRPNQHVLTYEFDSELWETSDCEKTGVAKRALCIRDKIKPKLVTK